MPAWHAAARCENGITTGPVVARLVVVQPGRPAKFAHPEDQRLIQQSAFLQVIQQHRQRVIGQRELPCLQDGVHPGVIKPMRVPAAAVELLSADAVREVDVDELHARFDQPPGQQATLPIGGAAIAVAQFDLFLGEVERLANCGRTDHRERSVEVVAEAPRHPLGLQRFQLGVQEVLHLAPPLKSLGRDTGGEAEFGEMEILSIGILGNQQWIMPLAEEAGVLSGGHRTVHDHVRQSDKRWQPPGGRQKSVGDRSVGGEQIRRVLQTDIIDRRCMPGQRTVGCRVVVVHRVVNTADERHLVEDLGGFREVFADRDTGDRRGDRSELRLHTAGGLELQVERVDMARSPELVQEDHRLGLGSSLNQLLGRQEVPHPQSQQPGAADAHRIPPCEQRGEVRSLTRRRVEHDKAPAGGRGG